MDKSLTINKSLTIVWLLFKAVWRILAKLHLLNKGIILELISFLKYNRLIIIHGFMDPRNFLTPKSFQTPWKSTHASLMKHRMYLHRAAILVPTESNSVLSCLHCVTFHLHIQLMWHVLCATMETSDWLEDHMTMKGLWNCALTIPGALSVVISGMMMMLVWFVPN